MTFSFVVRQGLGILADCPAWLLLTIFADHSDLTDFLTAVDSSTVVRQDITILADCPAGLRLTIFSDYYCFTDFLLAVGCDLCCGCLDKRSLAKSMLVQIKWV